MEARARSASRPAHRMAKDEQSAIEAYRSEAVRAQCDAADGRWSIAGVLALGALVRFAGLTVGLSGTAVGDEPSVVQHAMAFGSGDLNPHYFVYPAFYMYVLFAVFGLYYAVGRLAGLFDSAESFATAFLTDAGPVYLLGRLVSATAGLAAVWVLYRFVQEAFGFRAALLSSLFLALNPFHVWDSHFAIADAPMVLTIVLALWAIDRVCEKARPLDYLLAGGAIGLGAATKYIPVLLVIPLIVAHFWQSGLAFWRASLQDRRLWLGLAAVLVVFFFATPFTVLDASSALGHIQERIFESTSGPSQNRIIWTKLLVQYGPLFLAMVCLGGWIVVRSGTFRERMLLVFPLLFLGIAAVRGYWATRYFSPVMPVACILVALALVRIGQRWPVLSQGNALALMVAVILAVPAWAVIQDVRHLQQPTSRELATAWVKSSIPAGTKLVVDPYFRFPLAPQAIEEKLRLVEQRLGRKARLVAQALRLQLKNASPGQGYYILPSRNYPESASFGMVDRQDVYNVQEYLKRGAEYFVIGLPRYGEFEAEQYQVFYRDLSRCCQVVYEVPPGPDPRVSPPVRIYRVVR